MMESSSKVDLERALTQYEKHLTGLFALVILPSHFQRALSDKTRNYIKKNTKHISAITCWVGDPGIEDIADSIDTILFILEVASIAYVVLTSIEGNITHAYNG